MSDFEVDQAFNKFATEFAFNDPSTPAAPRDALTKGIVTVRTIGFPDTRFPEPVEKSYDYKDTPTPATCPAGPFTISLIYADNRGTGPIPVVITGITGGGSYPSCNYGFTYSVSPSITLLNCFLRFNGTGWDIDWDINFGITDFILTASGGPSGSSPDGSYSDAGGTGQLGTGFAATITNISIP